MSPSPKDRPDGLSDLLQYLKDSRGFDFSGYKQTSLERRIQKRMAEVKVDRYPDYIDYLEVNPDEFTELFNTILINVTAFYRDKPAWDYMVQDVLPKLIAGMPDSESLRVWSAGCASGEEAYTAAIVLAEALGEEQFKERVKIYATDVDQDALSTARHATYPRDSVKGMPPELVARYFESGPSGLTFRGDLRRQVIFGRNDLVQDAPISRVDLLVSRNTLMYFTAETQTRILSHFNFALKPTGFLFLGKSEMLVTHKSLFTPYNLKWRVFQKVPQAGLRERLAFVTEGGGDGERHGQLHAMAMETGPVAQVLVDRDGFLTFVNHRARLMFGLTASDVGRALHDLELSYRPADLRSALSEAMKTSKPVTLPRVRWASSDGPESSLEISVTPVVVGTEPLGASITFADVTAMAEIVEERERAKHQLETAYDELQSTVEELETTNEELHSTNEELETTNEELQSTNEELETMNEELTSTNDELEAMNEEQHNRTAEMDRVNLFLEGILGSLGVGVVVVDRELRVQVWNASSFDLWGLRAEEVVGKDLLSLDIGLPVEQLKQPVLAALNDSGNVSEHQVDALNRRGRKMNCWVRVQPLAQPNGANYGAILLMGDADSGFDKVNGG